MSEKFFVTKEPSLCYNHHTQVPVPTAITLEFIFDYRITYFGTATLQQVQQRSFSPENLEVSRKVLIFAA